MSTFQCPLVEYTLEKHPNADSLSIAKVLGWQCVVRTEDFKDETNNLGVYLPIDSITDASHELLGFLGGERVKVMKLRGAVTEGVLLPYSKVKKYVQDKLKMQDASWEKVAVVGRDFSGILGIKRWYQFKRKMTSGDAETPDEKFHKYTDVENYKNYKDVISFGEAVHISEKLHGTSARYGLIDDRYVVGSRNNQLKITGNSLKTSVWTEVFVSHNIEDTLNNLRSYFRCLDVFLYGEIVGKGIQDLKYGTYEPKLYAYDIIVGKEYVPPTEFEKACVRFNIPRCPVIKIGEFSEEDFSHVTGKSLLDDSHCREGIVVKPLEPKFNPLVGRVILKVISDEFYTRVEAKDKREG